MTETNKNPSSDYKIRFADCDMFGHLNNSKYLDYMIDAREDHLIKRYGFNFESYYDEGIGWVITNHQIAYLKPAIYNEIVSIKSTLFKLKEDILEIEIAMMNNQNNQLKAVLRSRLVIVDLKSGKKTVHPKRFMDWAKNIVDNDVSFNLGFEERLSYLILKSKK